MTAGMGKALILTAVLVLSSCASFPKWSETPQDCKRWEEGLSKDVYTAVKKQMSRKYICVEFPEVVELPSSYISDKTIKVRFNADVSKKLNLYFQPVEREIITKIGKSNTVDYEVINNSDKDILITSTYNVTPQKAGLYFNKLDCFCYEERKVLAGQKILLPVTFFISPDIINDPNTSELKSLTLSYTFFNVNNINVSNLY